MSLAWNTRGFLHTEPSADSVERTSIEYHFLSWRELYDKSILTADRYSSGAAQWVVQGGGTEGLYTVTVVSRPYYSLPQELCLAFDCFTYAVSKITPGGEMVYTGPPIERVALEFLALLSVFAREPLMPLGLRRVGNTPIAETPRYHYPPRGDWASTPPPFGINSPEFISLVKGFAQARKDVERAILAAAQFYQSGLSLIVFDPSVAYTSLVSAIECLAGYHCRDQSFEFDEVDKFRGARHILEQIGRLPQAETLVAEMKAEMLRVEHLIRKKFVSFFVEFVTDEFWQVPDELYTYSTVFPEITTENFETCLKRAYDARSRFVHGGTPFPSYVEFGLRKKCPVGVVHEVAELRGRSRFVPPLAWFERLTHTVIIEYMRQLLAPELVHAQKERLAEKNHLLEVLEGLPPNARDSLTRLVHWTARFLPLAVINPHAPNKDWADSNETVRILKEADIIGGEGEGLEGSSWLKNREVGEAVGEFVFGVEANPFRGNELLLPRNYVLESDENAA